MTSSLQLVIAETIAYRRAFLASTASGHELESFWLRKSKQVVISVLAVRNPFIAGKLEFFRGINLEVSLPAGALCAERNAIGSALAALPNLKREHFECISVLALPIPSIEVDADLGETPSIAEDAERLDKVDLDNLPLNPIINGKMKRKSDKSSANETRACDACACSKCEMSRKRNDEDLNPIGPCGVCEEWLRKIVMGNRSGVRFRNTPDNYQLNATDRAELTGSDDNLRHRFKIISFKSEKCDAFIIRSLTDYA